MTIATLSIDVVAQLGRLESGLADASRIVQTRADQMQSRFDGLNVAATSLAKTLAVGFAVTGISRFTTEALRGLDALNDFRDATGASIENASALENVALRTGTAFESVETSVVKLNKVLADAKPGSSQEALLKSIGLAADDLRQKDPAEALRDVAVALNRYEDSGNKARIIQELFGKSVKEVAPFLKDLAESGKLVATVTEKQAEEAEKFNKQLDSLKKNSIDVARGFVSELLPGLNKIAEQFAQARKEGFSLVDALSKLSTFAIGGALGGKLGAVNGSSELERLKQVAVGLQNIKDADERAGRSENESNSRRLAGLNARIAALQTISRVQQAFDPSAGPNAIGAIKAAAPDIFGGAGKSAKVKGLPEIAGAQDEALQAALARLNNTPFVKLENLRGELNALLSVRERFGNGGGMDEAIADITDEMERLNPALQAVEARGQRLKALLELTPSTKLDEARRDMELLADALEKGAINADQFIEAAQTRLGTLPDTLKEATDAMTEFSRQAGRNIQDALGSSVRKVLAREFDSIGSLFKNLLLDIASQAISAQLGRLVLGDFGKTGKVGGWVGSFLSLFSARGNVFNQGVTAFAGGGVFDSPTAFGFGGGRLGVMGEAGPEAVMPLKRGKDGRLGVAGGAMNLSQTYYIGQGVGRGEVVAAVQEGNKQLLAQLKAAGRL